MPRKKKQLLKVVVRKVPKRLPAAKQSKTALRQATGNTVGAGPGEPKTPPRGRGRSLGGPEGLATTPVKHFTVEECGPGKSPQPKAGPGRSPKPKGEKPLKKQELPKTPTTSTRIKSSQPLPSAKQPVKKQEAIVQLLSTERQTGPATGGTALQKSTSSASPIEKGKAVTPKVVSKMTPTSRAALGVGTKMKINPSSSATLSAALRGSDKPVRTGSLQKTKQTEGIELSNGALCVDCHLFLPTQDDLNRHKQVCAKRSTTRIFSCPTCSTCFCTRQEVLQHVSLFHKKPEPQSSGVMKEGGLPPAGRQVIRIPSGTNPAEVLTKAFGLDPSRVVVKGLQTNKPKTLTVAVPSSTAVPTSRKPLVEGQNSQGTTVISVVKSPSKAQAKSGSSEYVVGSQSTLHNKFEASKPAVTPPVPEQQAVKALKHTLTSPDVKQQDVKTSKPALTPPEEKRQDVKSLKPASNSLEAKQEEDQAESQRKFDDVKPMISAKGRGREAASVAESPRKGAEEVDTESEQGQATLRTTRGRTRKEQSKSTSASPSKAKPQLAGKTSTPPRRTTRSGAGDKPAAAEKLKPEPKTEQKLASGEVAPIKRSARVQARAAAGAVVAPWRDLLKGGSGQSAAQTNADKVSATRPQGKRKHSRIMEESPAEVPVKLQIVEPKVRGQKTESVFTRQARRGKQNWNLDDEEREPTNRCEADGCDRSRPSSAKRENLEESEAERKASSPRILRGKGVKSSDKEGGGKGQTAAKALASPKVSAGVDAADHKSATERCSPLREEIRPKLRKRPTTEQAEAGSSKSAKLSKPKEQYSAAGDDTGGHDQQRASNAKQVSSLSKRTSCQARKAKGNESLEDSEGALNMIPCLACGLRFHSAPSLAAHRRYRCKITMAEAGPKSHVCDCGLSFPTVEELQKHSELERQTGRYPRSEKNRARMFCTCLDCGQKFHRSQLSAHKRECSELMNIYTKVYACKHCTSFKTTAAQQLREHLLAYHPDAPVPPEPELAAPKLEKKEPRMCLDCGVTFPYEDFKVHKRVGCSERGKSKIYSCFDCHKMFMTRRELEAHKRAVHQVAGAFMCGWCQNSFYHYYDLRQHYEKVHSRVVHVPQGDIDNYLTKFKKPTTSGMPWPPVSVKPVAMTGPQAVNFTTRVPGDNGGGGGFEISIDTSNPGGPAVRVSRTGADAGTANGSTPDSVSAKLMESERTTLQQLKSKTEKVSQKATSFAESSEPEPKEEDKAKHRPAILRRKTSAAKAGLVKALPGSGRPVRKGKMVDTDEDSQEGNEGFVRVPSLPGVRMLVPTGKNQMICLQCQTQLKTVEDIASHSCPQTGKKLMVKAEASPEKKEWNLKPVPEVKKKSKGGDNGKAEADNVEWFVASSE